MLGPLVTLDAVAVLGSGAALQGALEGRLSDVGCRRATLNVQSLSAWAPLAIGPYCQSNTITLGGYGGSNGTSLILASGSIGLQPDTMTLVTTKATPPSPSATSTSTNGGGHRPAAVAAQGAACSAEPSPRASVFRGRGEHSEWAWQRVADAGDQPHGLRGMCRALAVSVARRRHRLDGAPPPQSATASPRARTATVAQWMRCVP